MDKEAQYKAFLEEQDRSQSCSRTSLGRLSELGVTRRSKVAVIDFELPKPGPTNFRDSNHLREHLETAFGNMQVPPDEVVQSLYIVEDLDLGTILTLGSRLRVPPSVFAAHCGRTATDDRPYEQHELIYNHRNFAMLSYRHLFQLPNDFSRHGFKLHHLYDIGSNVPRAFRIIDGQRTQQSVRRYASFWSNRLSNDSWVAILMVDPLTTRVAHVATNKASSRHFALKYNLLDEERLSYPIHLSTEPLLPESTLWKSAPSSNWDQSLFALLCDAYQSCSPATLVDPRAALSPLQAFLRQTYRACLIARQQDYYVISNQGLAWQQDQDATRWFHAGASRWAQHSFRALTYCKLSLIQLSAEIDENIRMLDVDSDASIDGLFHRDQWKALVIDASFIGQKIDTLIDAFKYETGNEQARSSNAQTRNVDRLTAGAFLLLPATICAGIFSMQGNFAPGGSQFWVFWVVAVASSVSCFVVFFFPTVRHYLATYQITSKNAITHNSGV